MNAQEHEGPKIGNAHLIETLQTPNGLQGWCIVSCRRSGGLVGKHGSQLKLLVNAKQASGKSSLGLMLVNGKQRL